MPIPVTKYRCAFKCGQKSKNKLSEMVSHESNCWENPANKTCKTCINEIYDTDNDDFRSWNIRGCKLSAMDDFFDKAYDELKVDSGQIQPIFNCPYHNQTEMAEQEISEFSVRLLGELETKKAEPTHHFNFQSKNKESSIDESSLPF